MTLHHMLRAAAGNSAGPSDPYFEYNTLLLNGDGAANGAQNNTFVDSSSNNLPITRNGNTTQGTFSPYGSLWSNYFVNYSTGSGGYLSTPSSTEFGFGTGDFTVECWAYKTPNTSVGFVQISPTAGGLAGSTNSVAIGCDINNVVIYANNTSYVTTDNPLSLSNWNHVAVVRSSYIVSVYVNGVKNRTIGASGNIGDSTNYTGRYTAIGGYYSTAYLLKGYISNLRVVKGTAIYTSDFTPSTIPLTAVSGTSLLTCKSNRLIDNSSNNFTLTRNGDVSVQRFSPFNPTTPYSASTIGGSGYFDAAGDWLTTSSPSFSTTGDFTMECWAYINNALANTSGLISFRASNIYGGGIGMTTARTFEFAVYAGSGSQQYTGTAVPVRQWFHVALVRSGSGTSNCSCYLNGVRVGQFTSNAEVSPSGNVGAIGRWLALTTDPNTKTANGYISDARYIVGSALYSGETYTIPTAPLTAVSGTMLLCNFTNAGIPDAAMLNDVETVGNAQVSTSVKKYGTGSLAFDGAGDYLRIGTTDVPGVVGGAYANPDLYLGTGDFTIELWAYLIGTSTKQFLYDQRASNNAVAIAIYVESNALYFYVSAGVRISGSFTTTSAWAHIALARSGTETKMFVDGVQVGSTYGDSNNYLQNAVYVGSAWDGSSPLNGYIDDLRVTKGYARYTSSFTPPTAALPTY